MSLIKYVLLFGMLMGNLLFVADPDRDIETYLETFLETEEYILDFELVRDTRFEYIIANFVNFLLFMIFEVLKLVVSFGYNLGSIYILFIILIFLVVITLKDTLYLILGIRFSISELVLLIKYYTNKLRKHDSL